MDLELTDTQSALRNSFGTFFANQSPPERVRRAEPLGFDLDLWRQLVGLGIPAMGVPAEYGGHGAALLEMALVAEAAGQSLAPVPLVESTVAARVIAGAPRPELSSAVLDGTKLATLVLDSDRANAIRHAVPAGAVAHLIVWLDGGQLVATEVPDSVARRSPENLAASPVCFIDSVELRNGSGWLAGAPRHVLAEGELARRAYRRAVDEWRVLSAAALAGLARGALDLGVNYVKSRHQFGVPIGSFQAVQHRLADVATEVEGARWIAYEAAWALAEDPERAPALASMAMIFNSSSAERASSVSLHFHGGYGFMLEYDIQLYFRRAKGWSLLNGDPGREHQRLARLLFGSEDG